METESIRTIYRKTELWTTFLLLIDLPLFGIVYLYHNSGNLHWDLPTFPVFLHGILVGAGITLLIVQYVLFHKQLKAALEEISLVEKVKIYTQATLQRFILLFLVSILSTFGLLVYQSPWYILLFAVCLVFFSLGKPSPDRIARLVKVKKEDREILREASRPA